MAPLRLNQYYLALTLILFGIELCIALFVHDRLIRPYMGDILVVALIYCFLRSFLDSAVIVTACAVFGFACLIEVGQYFHVAERLQLSPSKVARTAIGNTFSWMDIVCYATGTAIILLAELFLTNNKSGLKSNRF